MISLVAFLCKCPQQEFIVLEHWKLKLRNSPKLLTSSSSTHSIRVSVERPKSVSETCISKTCGVKYVFTLFRLKYRKLKSHLQKVVFEFILFSNWRIPKFSNLEILRILELKQSERQFSLVSSSSQGLRVHTLYLKTKVGNCLLPCFFVH